MNRRAAFPTIGSSSLLVIFAALCLTVLALLSVSCVQADSKLADKATQAVTDYYRADCQAQAVLARLRSGEQPQGVTVQGDTYHYFCRISDTQALAVSVCVTGGEYTVLRWQTVSTVRWEADDRIPVWAG